MGGKSKAVTVGYKHYVGMHCVFTHGPIDAFTRVSCDERIAWTGHATGGTIPIMADELFGGESREGGFSGSVDIQMGGMAQGKNAYLLSKIGPNIPAYRGVAAMVFKDFYWGNNPYLKPVSARGQRIHVRENGIEQWYDAKAEIPSVADYRYLGFYLVWEMRPAGGGVSITPAATQTSTFNIGDGETHDVTLRVRGLVELRSYPGSTPVSGHIVKGGSPGSPSVANEYRMTISNPPATYYFNSGNFGSGELYDVDATITVPVADGAIVTLHANTGSDSAMSGTYQYLSLALDGVPLDLNPAHIIRECLTNPDWGMGYDPADIDDTSFTAAADTLYQEGLGMSLIWDKQAKIEDFVNEIVRHIDAALFVSRTTGQFVLKLIRDDYDPETLILLDESNIEQIENPTRAAFGELINSVTVQFWNSTTGKDDSITLDDPAGVQQQGTPINTTLQYPGFTNLKNANVAAARDLRALSNPFLSCTIYTGEIARDLEPGDVFKLTWGKWKLQEVVMRVTGFALSDGRGEQVRLTCVEDVFSTPLNAVLAPPGDGWVDPSQPPEPVDEQIAGEAPYYELVQINGQTQTDSDLAANPMLGYVIAAAGRPASAINAKLWTDAGAGFAESDVMDFAPSAVLTEDIGKTTLTTVVSNMTDLDLISLGSHFQLGAELLRLDALDHDTGAITFGRGVLDTVPHDHSAGDTLFFWDLFYGVDPTEYAAGESVDVRITPVSGSGQVALADAIESTVLLDQRAYRPYAPGNLTINGDSYVNQPYTGELTVEWAHRDRLQQTSGELADHFDGDIGPEAGTTYRVRAYVDDVLDDEQDEIDGTDATVIPVNDGLLRIEVHSKRDGVYSWQGATHEFPYSSQGAVRLIEESADYRADEDGNTRITED